jgi:hypothetical protein
MSPEDAEEYTQSMGLIAAGAWRQVALGVRLGIPKALGLTPREWVETRLGGYVRLSLPERQQAALELNGEGMSQREIAGVLGVDHKTVGSDLRGENSPSPKPKPIPEQAPKKPPVPNSPPPKPRDDPEQIERETRRSYQEGLVRFADLSRYGNLHLPAQRARAIDYWPPIEPLDGATRVTPEAFRQAADICNSLADLLERKSACDTNPKSNPAESSSTRSTTRPSKAAVPTA